MTTRTSPLRCQRCGNPLTSPRQRRWCSKECSILGRAAANRAARNASQARWREKVRRAKAGIAPSLTPEQRAIVALTTENIELRRTMASLRERNIE